VLRVNYERYFRTHYGSSFSERDIANYEKWFDTQWRLVRREAPLMPNARILEIGSGTGGFFSVIKGNESSDYTGIELDSEACDFANNYFDTSVFKNVSLQDIPVSEPYDLVYAFEVLEHLDNPSEAVEKIYSMLKPGGTFCGTTPFPFKKNIRADDTHLSVLHPINWQRLFQMAGFNPPRTFALSFAPLLWRINPRLNIRIPFYVPISGVISTCLIIACKDPTISSDHER
jgi:2-polyprenyl-3-methyl-5-hydroxy-6-metoxy-1,4-benzoquinol methylase